MSPTGNNKSRSSILDLRSSPSIQYPESSIQNAFTLIELLISVVILGFGLVLIIRSFTSSISGLNASQNYLEAMKLAKEKLIEKELLAYEDDGLFEFGAQSGSQHLGSREFEWLTSVNELDGEDEVAKRLVEVCIRLDWKEANIDKHATLAAYLPKFYEEEEEEGTEE